MLVHLSLIPLFKLSHHILNYRQKIRVTKCAQVTEAKELAEWMQATKVVIVFLFNIIASKKWREFRVGCICSFVVPLRVDTKNLSVIRLV